MEAPRLMLFSGARPRFDSQCAQMGSEAPDRFISDRVSRLTHIIPNAALIASKMNKYLSHAQSLRLNRDEEHERKLAEWAA